MNFSNLKVEFKEAARKADQRMLEAVHTLRDTFNLAALKKNEKFKKGLRWTTALTAVALIGVKAPTFYYAAKDPTLVDARVWSVDTVGTGADKIIKVTDYEGNVFQMQPNQRGVSQLEKGVVFHFMQNGVEMHAASPFYWHVVQGMTKTQYVDFVLPKEVQEMYAKAKAQREQTTHAGVGYQDYKGNVADYAAVITVAAAKYGIDENYMKAKINQESGGNPNAVSSAGAIGLCQFMPATAAAYGIDPKDPVQSIFGMAAYTRDMLNIYNGDYVKACASYNCNPAFVQRQVNAYPTSWREHLPDQTRNYIDSIFGSLGYIPVDKGVAPDNTAPAKQAMNAAPAVSLPSRP